ncbi:MAG: hypothetical protein JWQ43_1801 [Glaciihabitans sp.]|nr:hypothetical protein [Glaciihabitans sp.]
MTLLLDNPFTDSVPTTHADATRADTTATRVELRAKAPLGGSYVTRPGTANTEGRYVSTRFTTIPATRGTYVTTLAGTHLDHVGQYTDAA